ncbi:CrcB protein [Actinoplanes lutulentus]|uniref:Fluoride-specific ion channel FluC n=1 Tax=Actinoplanes lutulentus TaxID=1287878 RepID=A0A327Z7N3_9ACTN|nr:CrcB family protein [Actinoplanes lutulentus]MBB2945186.1 CrcB protein [Actinoplanes lutulentus]RAK31982.1 camphor resistance protein CrcB [Actinoplanes lutulentus]
MTFLMVALGAAIGAPLRYLAGQLFPEPWGTLTVNVVGSLILGVVLGLPLSPSLTALLGTGFCGALTTYSTFSWETLAMARRGERAAALRYVTLSVSLGLGAAWLAQTLTHWYA